MIHCAGYIFAQSDWFAQALEPKSRKLFNCFCSRVDKTNIVDTSLNGKALFIKCYALIKEGKRIKLNFKFSLTVRGKSGKDLSARRIFELVQLLTTE